MRSSQDYYGTRQATYSVSTVFQIFYQIPHTINTLQDTILNLFRVAECESIVQLCNITISLICDTGSFVNFF